MARKTKTQREADQFRAKANELLLDGSWLHEDVRQWLQTELTRSADYIYTDREQNALRRIVAAVTLFDAWDGYTIEELAIASARYMADYGYEDEMFLKRLLARGEKSLRVGEMGWLVSLARNSGIDIAPFDPELDLYNEAA